MRALALLALAGCDAVFGLSGHPGEMPDATVPPADGPDGDAPMACTLPAIELPLVEDAEMIASNPTQGHGTESILNLGVGEVILKFDATTLKPANIHHLRLVIPAVQTAKECGSGGMCGPCASLDRPGKLRVSFLRSDWLEATASYSQRSTGMIWQQAGALGTSDRDQLITTSPYVGIGDASVDVSLDNVDAWLVAGPPSRVSLVVTATDGAQIIERQHQTWAEGCTPTPAAPVLMADPCP